MIKALLSLSVCVALAAASALFSEPAQAQSPSYYFVSVCTSGNPIDCPYGPAPVWFGPFPSAAVCNASHDSWQYGIFGTPPRSLSTCFPM